MTPVNNGRLGGGKRRHDPSARRRICGSIYAYAGNASSRSVAPSTARVGLSSNSQAELDDHYLVALAKDGQDRRLRHDRPPLPRLRPSQGLLLLPARRRVRRPDPGGPARPLQGDPRLPHRPRVELPQLRRALHHPPDHHRGQDRDPQQAHAPQPVRLLQPDPGRGRRLRHHPRRDPARPQRPRPGQPGDRHRRAGEPRLLPLRASPASSPTSRAESSPSTSTATPTRRSASGWSATPRPSTTPCSGSSARSGPTSPRARCAV